MTEPHVEHSSTDYFENLPETIYGLTRGDIADDTIDEWDDDRIDHDDELMLLMAEVANPTPQDHAKSIATAALMILQAYDEHNRQVEAAMDAGADVHPDSLMTPAKALHTAIIWDRG